MIIVRHLNSNVWAGVAKFRNCFTEVSPYIMSNGQRYTGFDETNEKERLAIEKDIKTDLSKGSEFWDLFSIKLSSEDLVLYPEDDPYDRLKYNFLKNHMWAKTSLNAQKAIAKFVLINKDDEAKAYNIKAKVKRECLAFFDKMSPDDMRNALKLYGINPDVSSNEFVQSELNRYIEDDPSKFKLLWIDNPSRKTEILLATAITKSVVSRRGRAYYYNTTELGNSKQETISFLDDPHNSDVRLGIRKLVE